MSNKPPTKKQPTKNKRNIWLAISLVVALIIAIGITYKNHRDTQLDQADKQRFETVEKSVKKLHQQLQQASAPGVVWEFDAYCREGGAKFQNPLISCNIETSTTLKADSNVEANKIIKKYHSMFRDASEREFKFIENYEAASPNLQTLRTEGVDGAVYSHRKTNMKCEEYFTEDDSLKKSARTISMEVTFSCGDYSQKLYYPERKLE